MSCQRQWVSEKSAALRVRFAKTMLARYPRPKGWYNVRSSDETHFRFESHGRMYVTRRPSGNDCAFCVQKTKKPKAKDIKWLHAWGAVGFDFKGDLIFYDNGTSNGKIESEDVQVHPRERDSRLTCWNLYRRGS